MCWVTGCGGSAGETAGDGAGNGAEGDTAASGNESSAATCTSQYPRTLPFDIGTTFAPRGLTVEEIALQCRAQGGEDCDAQQFISMAAALCISRQEVMRTPSERGRVAGLLFAESGRVEWSVAIVLPSPFSPQDQFCRGLDMVDIDAVTGLVRNRYFLEGCA